MILSPDRYGIGEHGYPFAEKGAGFDFQQQLLVFLLKQEIEAMPSPSDLRSFHPCPFETWYETFFNEQAGHGVCHLGVKQDNTAGLVHGDTAIPFACPAVVRSKIDAYPRDEQFPEATRIGEMGDDCFAF